MLQSAARGAVTTYPSDARGAVTTYPFAAHGAVTTYLQHMSSPRLFVGFVWCFVDHCFPFVLFSCDHHTVFPLVHTDRIC